MIKFNPGILSSAAAKLPKQTAKHNTHAPKIDLTGEEKGFYKVGNRMIKVIFPR